MSPGPASALTLLVPRIRADDHNPAMPADDPALAADLLHTRLDLHLPGLSCGAADQSRCAPSWFLLVPVDNPPTTEVVGAQLDDDPVIGQDPGLLPPHPPADVGQDLVPVVQLHSEKGVRERLHYRSLNLDGAVFLGHALRA